eukprot:1175555-Prorocentrum_minimum.AAC.2
MKKIDSSHHLEVEGPLHVLRLHHQTADALRLRVVRRAVRHLYMPAYSQTVRSQSQSQSRSQSRSMRSLSSHSPEACSFSHGTHKHPRALGGCGRKGHRNSVSVSLSPLLRSVPAT